MDIVKRINVHLINLQKAILFVSSFLIVIGLAITVTMRYFIKSDFFGLEELLIIPAFWLYFIGASYGSYRKYHITVDIVNTYISRKKLLKIIQIITGIITIFVALIMAIWAFDYVKWTYVTGSKSSAWKIPLFIPNSSAFIGFILMTLYLIRDVVINVIEFKNELKDPISR